MKGVEMKKAEEFARGELIFQIFPGVNIPSGGYFFRKASQSHRQIFINK